MTTASDAIWNRAAMRAGGSDARAGDQSVAALLRFHSRAMSGGVLDALTELDPVELDDAVDGYRYLDLGQVADVVSSLRQESERRSDDEFEVEADARYAALVPDDATLVEAFERRVRERPGDFAPVE